MRILSLSVLAALVLLLSSCENAESILIPRFGENSFIGQTYPLSDARYTRLEGVYSVESGAGVFGDSVVVKWTGKSLSIFTGVQVGYMILQGGYLDSVGFFEGFWRKQQNNSTGLVRFILPKDHGGRWLIADSTTPASNRLELHGSFGYDQNSPTEQVLLRFARPINPATLAAPFLIVAHRGGGRTSDGIPRSENTSEMLSVAQMYGANGVEIDVRLSKDGIPFLYHDTGINPRLVRKGTLIGATEEYTYDQLRTQCTLIRGEKMPTLKEALDTIIERTNLRVVWLDTKSENIGIIAKMVPIINAANEKAKAMGRVVSIGVSMPTQAIYDEFMAYPGHENILSLCELSPDMVRAANSKAWGPRWTQGTQNADVAQMHAEGRIAICWTLDDQQFIQQFLREGSFDGFLTNYPQAVSFYHYMR